MQAGHPQDTIVRYAALPFSVVGAGFLIGYGVGKGWHSVLGVIVAIALVGVFFGSGFYVEKKVRELHPMMVMSAAMSGFAIKFMLLAIFLIALRSTDAFDSNAFGISAVCLALAWLTGEVVGFTKARFLYTDAGAKSMDDD